MFTGIIEHVGKIVERREGAGGVTFVIACPREMKLRAGDSVAINGVCHTVEEPHADRFRVTSVAQTLRVTTMGRLREGAAVNLETAATVETALGGHMVQGHVDGVGTVEAFVTAGEDRLLTIAVPGPIHDIVVDKGSIAIDGVSLTVAERHPEGRVTIAIIPFTFEHTVIGSYRAGDEVNVEADVIGKYVKQYVDRLSGSDSMRSIS